MNPDNPSAAQQQLGGFADKLVELTDDVLFADVWERPGLSPRDRSLITITGLVDGGNVEQMPFHLDLGRRNGLTQEEIVEAITHLAFYAGWPRAMSAITVAKKVFVAGADNEEHDR
jgi:4-carboxymuconolactone decarboxylase